MMSEASKMEWFDKYRTGQLTETEIATFKSQLEANSMLKIEYQDYLQIVQGIRQYEREELKAFLLAEEETPVLHIQSFRRRRWFMAIAAAIILLLMVPVYNYLSFPQRTYANHQLNLPADNLMGTADAEIEKNEQYFNAAKKALKKGKEAKAFSQLEKITVSNTNRYFLAQDQMALIHIKKDNTKAAKKILTSLTKRSENHFVKGKAEKLLKDLERSRYWF